MGTIARKGHSYEVYAILWVTRRCEAVIANLLLDECLVPREDSRPIAHAVPHHLGEVAHRAIFA